MTTIEEGDGEETPARPRVVVITGMSGAGKSSALKSLEDIGYEAVDNLPLRFLPALIEPELAAVRPLAIGIDVRTRDFAVEPFRDQIEALLAREDLDMRLVFLDCDDAALERRYSQTRRRHPLAPDIPVADGIRVERRRLADLRAHGNPVIDTTDLTEHDLKRVMHRQFSPDRARGMTVNVVSFAYGRGVPRQSDLVFDVRFLKNPHYVEELRPLTGQDAAVGDYIQTDPDFADFFVRLTDFLDPLLPRYQAEGKSYLTIAVGCTGGRHRSVYTAERLTDWLSDKGLKVGAAHRELGIERSGG